MGKTNTPATPRTARPKSAKQLAKAEANRLAYEARNAAIAQRRETLAKLTGVSGNVAAAEAKLSLIERDAETAKARTNVVAEMAHPVYGARLRRFIGQRPVDPCQLLVVIGNWKRVQGL